MKITCESSYTALKSHKSTDFLQKILKNLDLDVDIKEITAIFNKIKNTKAISIEEERKISSVVSNNDFKEELSLLLASLDIPKNKKFLINSQNIALTFDLLSLNSRVVDILNNKSDTDYLNCEGKTFHKITTHNKHYYLELQSEFGDFAIFKNIKSNKFVLVNTKKDEIIIESKTYIYFEGKSDEDYIYIQTGINGNKKYLVSGNNTIPYSKNAKIIENNYSLFFVDYHNSQIIQLDKDTKKATYRELNPLVFGEIRDNYILLLSEPECVGNVGNSYSNGEAQLFDIFRNKIISQDIHYCAYGLFGDQFIYLSTDMKNISYFDIKTSKTKTEKLKDIEGFNPDISDYENYLRFIKDKE